MQLRRVLLLFALVLGLSAVVASIAPPPEDRDEQPERAPGATASPQPEPAAPSATVSIRVPRAERPPVARSVAEGSRLTFEVAVPSPGDVTVAGLGLRRSADPLVPARFDLLATPAGRYAVSFLPVRGQARLVARLTFEAPVTVRPPRPGR